MKTLHLIRHAKSSWDNLEIPDRGRVLRPRGQRDAALMGGALAARAALPEGVLLSPANRAKLTYEGLSSTWAGLDSVPCHTLEGLYTFDPYELLQAVSEHGGGYDSLLLIGHNPAMLDAVNLLAGAGSLDRLPTAAYVCLGLEVDHWHELGHCVGALADRLFPRELK